VLFTYKQELLDRAGRRESLSKIHGFLCNCELCALPDDRSNALDTKIRMADEADADLHYFLDAPQRGRHLQDMIRAIQTLDKFMTTIIQERLFFDYNKFFLAVKLFAFFGNRTLLQQVGEAVLSVLRRHLGTGISVSGGDVGVEYVTLYLEHSLRHVADSTAHANLSATSAYAFDALLKKTASNIISNLQSLP
jgi:hypothetical protein